MVRFPILLLFLEKGGLVKPLFIKILTNEIEPVYDYTVTKNDSLTGEKTIKVNVLKTEHNAIAYDLIQDENIFIYENEEYVIKDHTEIIANGVPAVQTTAIHRFFDDLKWRNRIYSVMSGTYGIEALLDFALEGSGYTYTVNPSLLEQTVKVTDFGKNNSLALFQNVLELFSAEFDCSGNQIFLTSQIGADLDVVFKHKYNINSISKNSSTNELATFIKGYGKEKEENDIASNISIPYASKKGVYYTETIENKQATKQIGASFSFKFTGTGFSFKTIVHKMGGKWTFTIDKSTKTITTYATSTAEKTFEIIRGLENKEHTVTAVFKKDSDNPNTKNKTQVPFNYLLDGNIITVFRSLEGDEKYSVVTSYTSPLSEVFGIKIAEPHYDDEITDKTALEKKLESMLTDDIPVSITFTAVQLEEMNLSNINKGDRCWCILEPFDVNTQLRVVEIETYSNENKTPVLTFGNIQQDVTKTMSDFNSTQKTVDVTIDKQTKTVKDTALSTNVQKAVTNALKLGDLSSLPDWLQEDLADAILQMYESFTEINVRQPPYNLKADGTDEKEVLQKLLNLADEDGSVHLYFPEGEYGMSGYLRLYSNTFVRMHPKATIKRLGTGYKVFVNGELGNADFVTGYNGEGNIHFTGGCIDCNAFENPLAADKATTAFDLGHAKNLSFVNVEMKNNQNGHFVQIASCQNVLFDNCYIHEVNHLDSTYMNCEAIQIEVATDVSFPSFGGYDSTPSQNIRIINCNFENLVRGVGTHGYPAGEDGMPSVYCSDILLENCQFTNITDNAISLLAYKRVNVFNIQMEDIGGYALWARYLYDSTIDRFSCNHVSKSGIYMQYSENNEVGKVTLENTCEIGDYSAIRLDNANNNPFRNPVVRGATHRWAFFATSCENNRLYDYNFENGLVGNIGGDSLPYAPTFTQVNN